GNNRQNSSRWFYDNICSAEGGEVLFVSIGSRHTLDQIETWFQQDLVKLSHFRVLTWRPLSHEVVVSLCDHLGEDADETTENIDSAWSRWKRLEEQFDTLEVYHYTSIPTCQAICTKTSMKVELLPFNRYGKDQGFHESGSPHTRPAMFLSSVGNPTIFHLFRNA